jgi:hypothetical protein
MNGTVTIQFGLSDPQTVPVYGPTPVRAIATNPAIMARWQLSDNLRYTVNGSEVPGDFVVTGGEAIGISPLANNTAA